MASSTDSEFIALLEAEASGLAAFVRMIVRDRDAVDDIAQETCFEAWRARHRFEHDSDLGKWLRGIARIVILRHRRRHGRSAAVSSFTPEVMERLDDAWGKTYRKERVDEDAAALKKCIEQLGSDEREWLEEHYREERPLRELAERIGRTEDAVKMLFLRLRKKLFSCVERRLKLEVPS